jgi:hypothetical protein
MFGHGEASLQSDEHGFAAMLYHRRRPCANPAPGFMVDEQLAIHLEKDHG